MVLTLTPNGVAGGSHGCKPVTSVNPWLRDPILKSPERATCVSMLGKTLENLMPPLSGLYIRFALWLKKI